MDLPRSRRHRVDQDTKNAAMAQRATEAAVVGDPDAADFERIYRSLRLIRRVEEEIGRIYPTDQIKSPVHLSIGQEAVSVGICDALRPDDVVAPTYRGHAAYLAKGGRLKEMMAELYGKSTGVAGGKGGSMHLIDMSHNVLGASAVVGTTIPVALGYAFALKHMKTDRVVVAFFGDGATERGRFLRKPQLRSPSQAAFAVCMREQFLCHPHAHHPPLGQRSIVRPGGNL
jgi:TPP-dependent pyruvate/acetoin dehydrogenase alpha subunit